MLLAKSNPKRSLLHHTLDVKTMAEQYTQRWQHLETLIADTTLFDDLLFATLLHDLGKAASGFQALLSGEDDESWQRYRHEILSAALVATLPYSTRRHDILLAVLTHHMGMNDELGARKQLIKYDPRNDAHTPYSERLSQLVNFWTELKTLLETLKQYSPALIAELALPDDPHDLPDPFAALRETQTNKRRRRSRSKEQRLPLRQIFLRGLLVAADHLASAAVTTSNATQTNIVSKLPTLTAITKDTFSFNLNSHQHDCARTVGSVFLNAPTGSGKTEASLLWAQCNQTAQQSRHVFYALPFTASINAMYHRLKDAQLFGNDAVTLLHGRSSYFAYRWLCEHDADISSQAASKHARAARQRSKELYYPVKVLTPHQIVMAFLGVKGWERSLCEYAGGLFILDEIHAYDPKFTGLLFETLRRLTQELDAKVCIMSATFPSRLKHALSNYIGTVQEITLEPTAQDKHSRHIVHVLPGSLDDYLEEIETKLEQGLKVLVVANTVKGAMTCFEALAPVASNPCLIHGRLTQQDRQRAEQRLADNTHPVDLLIGTQAIEVSLDIDFDVLYTDPAPLDALLQRFGRINRKPAHQLAQLPEPIRYRDVMVCQTQLPDTPAIYDRSDDGKRLVTSSLEVLPRSEHLLESTVSTMIDTVYDEAQLASFLDIAQQKTQQLKVVIDNLEAGSEKNIDESVFEIDSIPIVPVKYRQVHQQCFYEKRFFDAQSYVFNISSGRYHGLKTSGQIQSEQVEGQTCHYGLFSYSEEIGPDFNLVERMEAEIW